MKKVINVTARDIARGKKNRKDCELLASESCPIALAAGRIFKGRVAVGHSIIADGTDFEMPQKAKTFVHRFDANRSVKPFKFEIEV